MKITVVSIRSGDLETGDLFTTAGHQYWDNRDPLAFGEKVYIRTDVQCPDEQKNIEVYRLTISK